MLLADIYNDYLNIFHTIENYKKHHRILIILEINFEINMKIIFE